MTQLAKRSAKPKTNKVADPAAMVVSPEFEHYRVRSLAENSLQASTKLRTVDRNHAKLMRFDYCEC
ncbi:hypothetical protein IMCC3088_1545 [Aequoribacter fuscus]|jgi:hypothetical protein|uniref:Uncharacterized protein n=1 Tax=Aequoribacter fuscus TaxID=2518989 RepID=F3KYF0_9GAMM|nr:hypothetical protein IMCC3088_1545 [Aequoribacter fuscus]